MRTKSTTRVENGLTDLAGLDLSVTGHAPFAMALVEGAGHIVRYANPAFCRLSGRTGEVLLGRPFCEILPENAGCATLLDRVRLTGKPESHTEQQRSGAQRNVWTYAMWPVVADDRPMGIMIQVTETGKLHETALAMNEALMVGSVRQHELREAAESLNARLLEEIGERTRAQRELREAQTQLTDRAGQLEGLVSERTSELAAMNKQLEAFVYSIAHDLRAPLRAMQGFSSLLLAEAGAALNATGKDHADRINKAAQFMDALLIDLLAFSRIDQQRVELTSVDLKTVIESVLSRLQHDIRDKNARVDIAGPWPVVLAHEPTLSQVLFNLMSNALKFVAPDVPPLVRVRTEDRVEFARLWVEDNGPGIAPDHQGQVFRLFTRLNGEQYAGTGSGLAIVQRGVERMGGKAGLESVPGQGSRFWIELKQVQRPDSMR